jgi:hypothetical protein
MILDGFTNKYDDINTNDIIIININTFNLISWSNAIVKILDSINHCLFTTI